MCSGRASGAQIGRGVEMYCVVSACFFVLHIRLFCAVELICCFLDPGLCVLFVLFVCSCCLFCLSCRRRRFCFFCCSDVAVFGFVVGYVVAGRGLVLICRLLVCFCVRFVSSVVF